jgi:hypothetical protein
MRIVNLTDPSHFVQSNGLTPHRTENAMTTLTQSPLAPLLERLFQEANAVSPLSIPWVAALYREDPEPHLHSNTDNLDLYGHHNDSPQPVSCLL